MAEIEKMNLESEDLVEDRLAQLKELMPEVFTESGIDFDKLRLELGDEVDEGQERYAFTWPGKMDAIRQSQTPSTATLRPCVEKSRGRDGEDGSFDSDNIYIEGDNLEVLKLLQSGYHGKVKMIYIDPPYNTGKDFVYKDKFGDTIENYKKQAGLANQSNADTSGRYHSDWCSMMYPRLRLARELLSDDGFIFISIDENEVANLEIICNEIFGETNLIDTIIWKKRYGGGAKEKYLVTLHEYVLVYCKNISVIEEILVPLSEESAERYYSKIDEHFSVRGGYRTHPLEAGKAMDARPNLVYPIPAPDGSSIMPKRQWLWGKDRAYAALEKGELEIARGKDGKWVVSTKQYLRDEEGKTRPGKQFSIIDNVYTQHGTNEIIDLFGDAKIFSYPKPTGFLRQLINIPDFSSGDIILDFFSGSGSTLHALFLQCLDDGVARRGIMVQLPECCPETTDAFKNGYATLCEIGEKRIRLAGDKIKAEVEQENVQPKLDEEPKRLPDIGFRVFSLDNSGIEKPQPGQLVLDVVKPDRSDMDIVFEMMLKWGLELTLPVEKEEVAGYPVYSVACGELVCCLADGLTMEALDAIADMEPRRVLMRDSILTDTLKLNAVQAFRRVEERAGYEVQLRTV